MGESTGEGTDQVFVQIGGPGRMATHPRHGPRLFPRTMGHAYLPAPRPFLVLIRMLGSSGNDWSKLWVVVHDLSESQPHRRSVLLHRQVVCDVSG